MIARDWAHNPVDRGHTTPCWIWTAARSQDGYGLVRYDGRMQRAHRAAYTDLVGAIPEGLQLDHLCRQRDCVNPAHLEPVTGRENTLRSTGPTALNAEKTHCPEGHPYSGSNLYQRPNGGRGCVECRRAAWRRYYARKVAA